MVKGLVSRLLGRGTPAPSPSPAELQVEARRGRLLVEESREIVVVLDDDNRVVAASRRARESYGALREGAPVPDAIMRDAPLVVAYDLDGHRERLVYVRTETGHMAAYEELRAGFTAAVSHELRTPLARLLALLESALLDGADYDALIEQARAEVNQIGELIDDVLFLSELETGREVVGLGSTRALPILREVAIGSAEQSVRAGVTIEIEGDETVELPLRPRMIRVIASNLVENAIRHAGTGATATLSLTRMTGEVILEASDNGTGVPEAELSRLFERFYRTDRARASRGTGLGLAIVKHVVTSAGGTVEASGGPGRGLTIRCVFPVTTS
jgi:two-component system, OmpR family, phosphate regulon sensor histidine kinase PhoR